MTNHHNKGRSARTAGTAVSAPIPVPIPVPTAAPTAASTAAPKTGPSQASEPEVRRWPHPIPGRSASTDDAALHYICCSLSYQNQLLADVKSLLEQLAASTQTKPMPETPAADAFPCGPQVTMAKK